jgi:HK97 family phage major capsid protein
MTPLQEIRLKRQKRQARLDEAQEIVARAIADGREPTAEEAKKIADNRKRAAAQLTEIEILEEGLGERATSSINPADIFGGGGGVSERACGEFGNLGEMLQRVRDAAFTPHQVDPRFITRAAAGAAGAVPSDGGFAVDTDFAQEVLRKTHNTGQLSKLVRKMPVGANANGIKINAIDESSRVTGSRWGGVQVYWAAEAGTTTAKKPKFRQIQMDLQKLFGLFYATDELLQDSTALATEAERAFTEEFGFTFDDSILRGDGVGKPLGVLNSPALITVAKETNQVSATFTAGNALAMWGRLAPGSEDTAIWLCNKDALPQLPKLNIPVSTAGGALVYMPPSGLSGAQYSTIYGRPVITCEQCSTLGTVGDVILFDPAQYLWIEKGGIQAASSIHVQFLTDETTFRWTVRVNGQPIWDKPLTPYQGTNTVSPYVCLAAR